MDTIRAFFSKIRALFPIFKEGQGRPPPCPPLVTRLEINSFLAKNPNKLNWESTKACPKTLAFSNVKYFLICLSAWSLYDTVWHHLAICFSKLSLLFIINLSNSISADSFITFESINKLYSGRLVLLRIINWNFSGFAFMELIWNQVKTFRSGHQRCSL